MKHFTYLLTLGLGLATAGCSAEFSSDVPPLPRGTDEVPIAKSTPLSGTLFGAHWTAHHAGARSNDNGDISVTIVADESDACSPSGFSDKPFVTIVLPHAGKDSEYVTDSARNLYEAPAVMIDPTSSPIMNLISDKSRAKSTEHSPSGFKLALYARASDDSGQISELSGTIGVTNCDQRLSFQDWRALEGYYKVTSFDGRELSSSEQHASFIEHDPRAFQSATGENLAMVSFPLYTAINSSSTANLDFGPLQGLGQSWKSESEAGVHYHYEYVGTIHHRGVAYELNLKMEVLKDEEGNLSVNYTAEVPGQVEKTSHSFTLEK